MTQFDIPKPEPFDFQECLHFLARSDNECMHRVDDNRVSRLIFYEGKPYLFTVEENGNALRISIHSSEVPASVKAIIKANVTEWFDMSGPLQDYYDFAGNDQLLAPLCLQFRGLRLIGIPDLFEAISWAIIGQQINLRFAYQIKRQFVQAYGQSFEFKDYKYYDFPKPADISSLAIEDLRALQFSRQKAEYLINVAQLLDSGALSKEILLNENEVQAEARLCAIRGIGNWTAQYVLLKCLQHHNALPLQDAGLHQAIKNLSGMSDKPDLATIKSITDRWEGWKGYATFYCWHSLLYQ